MLPIPYHSILIAALQTQRDTINQRQDLIDTDLKSFIENFQQLQLSKFKEKVRAQLQAKPNITIPLFRSFIERMVAIEQQNFLPEIYQVFESYFNEHTKTCIKRVEILESFKEQEKNFAELIQGLATQYRQIIPKISSNKSMIECNEENFKTLATRICLHFNEKIALDTREQKINQGSLFKNVLLNLCYERSEKAFNLFKKLLKQNTNSQTRRELFNKIRDDITGATLLHVLVCGNTFPAQQVRALTPEQQRLQFRWVRYLLEQGVDPFLLDNQGNSILHVLLASGENSARRPLLPLVGLLLQYAPGLVHSLNPQNQYPLHVAMEIGWVEAVEALFRYSYSSYPICNETGNTLLHTLVEKIIAFPENNAYRSILGLFLADQIFSQACINTVNLQGKPPLSLAVMAQDCQTVSQILQNPEWVELDEEQNSINALIARARDFKNAPLVTILQGTRANNKVWPAEARVRLLDKIRDQWVKYHALEKLSQPKANFGLVEKHHLYRIAAHNYPRYSDPNELEIEYQHFMAYKPNMVLEDAFIEESFESVRNFFLLYSENGNQIKYAMGDVITNLLNDIQNILTNIQLSETEHQEVEGILNEAVGSYLKYDEAGLRNEIAKASPQIKSNILTRYIRNHFSQKYSAILPTEFNQISLAGLDLSHVNLSILEKDNINVANINFDNCIVEEMDITNLPFSPLQFVNAQGIISLHTHDNNLIPMIQAEKMDALRGSIERNERELDEVEQEIFLLERLHELERDNIDNMLERFNTVALAKFTILILNSLRLNNLPDNHPCCYMQFAEKINREGIDGFLCQAREAHENVLREALVALNLPVTPEAVILEKLNKLTMLENVFINDGSLKRRDLKLKEADLDSAQRQDVEGLLTHWQNLERIVARQIQNMRVQYEENYFKILNQSIHEKNEITQENFDEIYCLVKEHPTLKLIVDLTKINLETLNLGKYNLSMIYLKLSANQSRNLTAQQKRQRESAFLKAVTQQNMPDIMRWLECGVDVNAKDPNTEWTALMMACFKSVNEELVEYLLSQGADPNLPSTTGWRIIQSVANQMQGEQTLSYLNVARCLVNPNYQTIVDPTSAMLLAYYGDVQYLPLFHETLKNNKALHDIEEVTGRTLLHSAIAFDLPEVVRELITLYAFNPWQLNREKQNAFCVAVLKPSYACLQLLLQLVQSRPKELNEIFYLVAKCYFDCLMSLNPTEYQKHEIYFNMLQLFQGKNCRHNNATAIALSQNYLVTGGWRTKKLSNEERSKILFHAVAANQKSLIKALPEGVDFNISMPGVGSLLHVACRQGNLDMMKLLCDEGVSLQQNEPLLITAIRSQLIAPQARSAIIRWLVTVKKVDINEPHILITPLQEAAKRNDIESIQLLLHLGADIHRKVPENPWTALDYAADANAVESIAILLEALNAPYMQMLRPIMAANREIFFRPNVPAGDAVQEPVEEKSAVNTP